MLYLPRLFVYHAEAERKSAISEQFKSHGAASAQGHRQSGDDRRLDRAGCAGVAEGYLLSPWLHAKLALVLLLTGLHGYFAGRVRAFAEDRETPHVRSSTASSTKRRR